jgi:hypothetical protein
MTAVRCWRWPRRSGGPGRAARRDALSGEHAEPERERARAFVQGGMTLLLVAGILWGSITRSGWSAGWDHRWVILSVACLLARCLLRCLMVRARREVSEDAGLLVLRHENAVLRRQISKIRCQPGGRLRLTALSRLIPRHR